MPGLKLFLVWYSGTRARDMVAKGMLEKLTAQLTEEASKASEFFLLLLLLLLWLWFIIFNPIVINHSHYLFIYF